MSFGLPQLRPLPASDGRLEHRLGGRRPARNTIEFSILNYNGALQTLTWEKEEVFDSEWHKLHFGVWRDKVVLYVNCEPVGEEPLQVVDSRIDLNGEIMIAKEEN